MTGPRSRRSGIPLNPVHAGVAPLELYFDLVFVFALTQVTVLMAHDLGPTSITRGVLILGLLWSGWAGYAWLGNLAAAHSLAVRNVLLVAMFAVLVLALAIPEAFHDVPGGLDGPLVVAVCYLAFRGLHLLMFWRLSAGDASMRRQLARFAPAVLSGTALLFVAAFAEGATQTALWGAALAADYVGVAVGGARGWHLRSTAHFSERHGEIVIIALGESILAIGVAVGAGVLDWPTVVASMLGLTVATSLWWVYFAAGGDAAHRRLDAEPDDTRPRLARNAYSVLHLPVVLGIVLVALGLKKVVEYASGHDGHSLQDPLPGSVLFALLGGILLFLLAHAAFRRALGLPAARDRFVVVAALALLWAVGPWLPGQVTLVCTALVMAVLMTVESVIQARAHHRSRSPHTVPVV